MTHLEKYKDEATLIDGINVIVFSLFLLTVIFMGGWLCAKNKYQKMPVLKETKQRP